MAYVAANLALMNSVNGFGHYRYDTTDIVQDVDANGYFNNGDDTLNLAVGDLIHIVHWTTAVRTGTMFDVSLVVVSEVDTSGLASDGVVQVSSDIFQKGIFSSA